MRHKSATPIEYETKWCCYSLPIFFPPAVSSTTPTHGYFLLSQVSLADGDPTIDIYDLMEI